MQIEKYVHITKTPNGALVSFAGQVCLTISHHEGLDSYFWRASPMFVKLTTGANAFEAPQSYTSHPSMAEAVADGLTKLDEMGAFYGVIDLPEDTHGTLSEEYEEDIEAMLVESFVVRKTEKSRGVKSRIMISAAAVLGRAAELAKEEGVKAGPKHVKAAHKEFSAIKAEGEEFIQYEDATVDALASIKEDCRAEALSMCDSLLEAQQLASELFENIVEEYLNLSEARLAQPLRGHPYHKKSEAELNYIVKDADQAARANKGRAAEGKYLDQMNDASTVLYYRKRGGKQVQEELDEATRPLSGDAYWKSKEVESKEEYLKAQRKALGLPEPVKRGRGKPTNIDRDLLKTRAHSNVEAGKRPTAGFDRNEKIHFVRHLKNHPDFAEKHVSQAGRPVGTTKVAKQQQDLVKKKQDTAFSMWAGLGKK